MFDRAMKPYVLFLTLVFAAFFLAGIVAPPPVRKAAASAVQLVADSYRGVAGGTLFFYVLFSNVMVSILILVTGVLVGIVPILSVGSKGFFLGAAFRQAAETAGYAKAVWKILPHGVFEIPAILLAASYGLWLGVMVLRRWRGGGDTLLRYHVAHAFRRYLAVVFPLLVIAASIETALILYS